MTNTITRGLGVKVVLLTSLCLNVALGTFTATRWYESTREPPGIGAPPRLIEVITRRLPVADADVLRSTWRTKLPEFTDAQRAYWRALLTAGRILAQPELDAPALRTAIEDARNKRVKIGDLAIDTLLEALPQMSTGGRQALISGMRRR